MEPTPTPGWETDRGHAGERPHLAPHRGSLVLVLGILGLVTCFIPGIIAWSMGNTDLREMRAGRMDRTGESQTNAGRICGMISVIMAAVAVGIGILVALTIGFGTFHVYHVSR